MQLRYLYVGSSDIDRELAGWLRLPGARLGWRFRHFGADVAAIDLGCRPTVLLADHRPAGSVLPIYAVDDLEASVATLPDGWTVDHGAMGTPEGPTCVVRDPSGVALALLRVDRPDVMDGAYADPANTHAVR